MYNNKDLNIEELKDNIIYDPTSGTFTWSIPKQGRPANSAGTITPYGYRVLTYEGHKITASHYAWYFMTGEWPTEEVGYKDGNRSNLKWDNLFFVSRVEKQLEFRNKNEKLNGTTVVTRITQKAKFSNKQVTEAVEQFIKNKVLIDGRYIRPEDSTQQ